MTAFGTIDIVICAIVAVLFVNGAIVQIILDESLTATAAILVLHHGHIPKVSRIWSTRRMRL
jgi:hypothetical protein